MIDDSDSSSAPLSFATLANDKKSVRVSTPFPLSFLNLFVINCETQIRGARAQRRKERDFTVKGAKLFQLLAPIVLGMISDKKSINNALHSSTETRRKRKNWE